MSLRAWTFAASVTSSVRQAARGDRREGSDVDPGSDQAARCAGGEELLAAGVAFVLRVKAPLRWQGVAPHECVRGRGRATRLLRQRRPRGCPAGRAWMRGPPQ